MGAKRTGENDSRPRLLSALDDYRWLVGPEGQQWLEQIRDDGRERSLVQLTQRIRARLSGARAHLILEQVELRQRARDKFSRAERMFFTRRLLEQATDEWVATYKAGRFPAGAPLADLCCGLGGDLLGLASRGSVQAVDRDPVATLLAGANVTGRATATTGDVAEFSLDNVAAWHIDPDRRPAGRRTTRVELHEPGPAVLNGLLRACPHAAIKLAPAATLSEPWWGEAELEWIGRDRQCRQLVAWFGDLAQHAGRRRATVLRGGVGEALNVSATCLGYPGIEPPVAARVGRFFFEPDPAVLAGKLEGALAEAHGLAAVAGGVAYFTGERAIDDAMLAAFEVLEVMPYRAKTVRAWLAARGIGRLEVKKRGVRLDPEDVRRELQAPGDDEATVLLASIDGRATAIVARRMR